MLSRWQKTVVDQRGSVVPWAALIIRRESDQMPAPVYRDRYGADPYPVGQVTTDGNGFAYFYAAPGLYRITGTAPAIDWRDVGIGAPFDPDALGTAAAADLIESRYDATPGRVVTTGGFGVGVPDDGALEALDVDLDTVLISGDYYCADTCTNLPGTSPGFLSVLAGADPDRRLQRFVEDAAGGKEYRRIVDGTPGAMWRGSASGIPGATFAEVDALTADEGPIICTDQDGILYAWDAGTSKYVAQTADDATALAKSSATNLITPAGLGFSLQPTLTGSATFVKATNQIQMTDIVPTLALEAGDVIQISGSVSNDNLYTVESIADADNLIVNYEHRNGAGSLSLTDETVTVSVKRIAKWFNAPLGLGQAWVDVLSSRAKNTSYTSPANRTMAMSVSGYAPASQSWKIIVSGKTAAQGLSAPTSRMGQQLQANIPGNSVYELSNSDFLAVWAELR